jgi:F-type H+-transporting ATPase subunit b
MLIDWFTVGAQVLNFAVLAWLLKRLLYKPILDAIDTREKAVAKQITEAAAARAAAEREQAEWQGKNAASEAQQAATMFRAIEDANAERQRLIDGARQAADQVGAARRAALLSDMQNLQNAVGEHAQREVVAIVRKVLGDLATVELEEQVVAQFLKRLRLLDGEARAVLARALLNGHPPALVRSSFELPIGERTAIQQALEIIAARPVEVRFDTGPDPVAGIELTVDGQKLAWSIGEYLHALQQNLRETIESHAKARPGGMLEAGVRKTG